VSILNEAGAAAIKARKPIQINGIQPWLMAYRTKGGGYIIANDGCMSDSQKPSDLIYVWPGGGVVALSPLVNPDLVAEVEAVVNQ
jgi:hypothetical protein